MKYYTYSYVSESLSSTTTFFKNHVKADQWLSKCFDRRVYCAFMFWVCGPLKRIPSIPAGPGVTCLPRAAFNIIISNTVSKDRCKSLQNTLMVVFESTRSWNLRQGLSIRQWETQSFIRWTFCVQHIVWLSWTGYVTFFQIIKFFGKCVNFSSLTKCLCSKMKIASRAGFRSQFVDLWFKRIEIRLRRFQTVAMCQCACSLLVFVQLW